MLRVAGLLSIAYVVLFLYCVLDVIRTEPAATRNLPKLTWLLLVLFVPLVGSAAWLLLGRPLRERGQRAGARGRVSRQHPSVRHRPSPPKGPDDDPVFLRRLEEQLRRDRRDDTDGEHDTDGENGTNDG